MRLFSTRKGFNQSIDRSNLNGQPTEGEPCLKRAWYSLTVRKETALRVRELARDKGLTVDELMRPTSKGVWSTCTVCGVRVKAGNVERHMARVHPKTVG